MSRALLILAQVVDDIFAYETNGMLVLGTTSPITRSFTVIQVSVLDTSWMMRTCRLVSRISGKHRHTERS